MVIGKCPYCNTEQELHVNGDPNGFNASYISKIDDPIITDSFNEMDAKMTCKKCKKGFHFMADLRK